MVLDEHQAWARSYELISHENLGNEFRLISNKAYKSIDWLDNVGDRIIPRDKLANDIANDIEGAIKSSLKGGSAFYRAVADAIPQIKEQVFEYVKVRAESDRIKGQEYYVRAYIAANAIDAIGKRMKL